jgi:hypothetical protein
MILRRLLIAALVVLWSQVATAEIYGFAINKIEGLNGVELDDRFGVTASATEHLVNYKDCLAYLNIDAGQSLDPESTVEEVVEATTTDVVETVDVAETVDAADAASDSASPADTSTDGSGGGGGATTEGIRKISIDFSVNDSLIGKWWYSIRIGSCTESSEVDEAATDSCTYLRQKTELTRYSTDTIEIPVTRILGYECAKGSTDDVRLYFTIQSDLDYNQRGTETVDIELDYDAPKPVTNLTLEAGEENLSVAWDDEANADTETVTYRVYWYDASFDEDTLDDVSSKGDLTAKAFQITGLENGKDYWVGVVALDDFDNESTLPDLVEGTPVLVTDGFEAYKDAGGAEKGGFGCTVNGGSATSGAEASAKAAAVLLLLAVALLAVLPRGGRRNAGRGA